MTILTLEMNELEVMSAIKYLTVPKWWPNNPIFCFQLYKFKNDIALDPSLELRFPFEPKRELSCCLQITNKADSFLAFFVKTDQNKYCANPNKGIMSPCSRCYITIKSQAQEKAPMCLDMIIVQGTRVTQDFTSDKITEDFLKHATAVDEVTLPIVYV